MSSARKLNSKTFPNIPTALQSKRTNVAIGLREKQSSPVCQQNILLTVRCRYYSTTAAAFSSFLPFYFVGASCRVKLNR